MKSNESGSKLVLCGQAMDYTTSQLRASLPILNQKFTRLHNLITQISRSFRSFLKISKVSIQVPTTTHK
jgi:hypothetical protein